MNPKELRLAASLLKSASNEFSNNGCNDWSFPKNWSQAERVEFAREYHKWNKSMDDFDEDDEDPTLADFAVMEFIASKLVAESNKT
jgi:hypothetical protein